jgi:hypothetical protein
MSCTLRSHLKTSNLFPEFSNTFIVAHGTFLTNNARVLLPIARDRSCGNAVIGCQVRAGRCLGVKTRRNRVAVAATAGE